MPTPRPTLADAIDIPLWLERDRTTSWAERAHRDRAIGREIPSSVRSRGERIMHWWHAIGAPPAKPERGRAVARLFRRLGLIMLAAGALSGAGLAAAVLRYDGSDPINILIVFGLLVLLPAVFLAASLALPLWPSSSFGGETNAGHIVLGFLSRHGPAFDEFFATAHADRARERFLRWRFMLCSQQIGLAFSLAALATLLLKTGFSDLAFAWSTTLDIDSRHMQQAIGAIAWPWSSWLPDAVPDAGLIERSRYFRLESDANLLDAATLTPWWRFLALCLLTYGVVPRALALTLALVRSASAERGLLLAHAEVRALLDRLDAPDIESGSETAEQLEAPSGEQAALFTGDAGAGVVIIWNGAVAPAAGGPSALVLEAGGERSPDEDREALSRLPQESSGSVRVIAKSWEPPLLEFHDYLKALREHVGDSVSIVVQPIGEAQSAPAPEDVAVWRASLARLGDPGVYVQ